MRILCAAFLLSMQACSLYVASNEESTTVGVTINHKKAVETVLNIFTKQEDISSLTKNDR